MSETFNVINPFNGETIKKVEKMTLGQIRNAIKLAQQAQELLSSLTISERSDLLMKCSSMILSKKEDLAKLMSSEIGRPIRSSRGEILRTSEIFKIAANDVIHIMEGRTIELGSYVHPPGNNKRLAMVIREPIGVVASITPFNFPASSFAQKVAPSLAVGNSVVHKPSKSAPLTQMELSSIIRESGFPENSVQIINGNSSEIGDEFVSNKDIAGLTFTGSESVGLKLAAEAVTAGKKVVMELGGSDPQIVLDDANLDRAAEAAVVGRFDYAGQFCNATKRLIVQESVLNDFISIVRNKMESLKIGNPLDEDTVMGPLIDKESVLKVRSYLDNALKNGGKILYSGEPVKEGNFFPPTLIRIDNGSTVLKEEVFGPLIPIICVKTDQEAAERANETEYGLDASVFSGNYDRAFALAKKIKAGTVIINDTTRLRWDNLPFGGVKKSGIGRESVIDSMKELTNEKMIVYRFDN